jgi:hypothetical protein
VRTFVGELGGSVGIAVPFADRGGGDTGVVGTAVSTEAGGGVGVTTGFVVVAAAPPVAPELRTLERRLPSPVLLVVAAAPPPEGAGVETMTPVEAIPLTPAAVAMAVPGAVVGVGMRMLDRDDKRGETRSGRSTLVAAAEELGVETTMGAAEVVVAGSGVVGVAVAVVAGGSGVVVGVAVVAGGSGVVVGVGIVVGSRILERA